MVVPDIIYAHLSRAVYRDVYPKTRYELSVEEVYQMVAETSILSGRGLDEIQKAGARLSKLALPSWVPDWPTDKLEFNSFYLTGYYGDTA